MTGETAAPARARIMIEAPARLHMGFIDLNGGLGRRFGSVGVALRDVATRVVVHRVRSGLSAQGAGASRALDYARALSDALGLPPAAGIEMVQTVPAHAGLGSGTQLALAIGVGLARLHGLPVGVREVARLAERGLRSGVGVGVFEHGGFVVDGGRGADGAVPPVVARLPFPEAWHFLLVLDQDGRGLHGTAEVAAFRRLPEFPAAHAAHLCRLVLMQMLPALSQEDLPAFGQAVTELQHVVGDYFAPAQGGRFTSPRVAAVLDWLARQGAVALGQSSWGPTGFAVVASAARARELRAAAERAFPEAGLRFLVSAARNAGAVVEARAAQADANAIIVTRQAASARP